MNEGQESFNRVNEELESLSLASPAIKTNTVKDVIDKNIANFEEYLNSKVINIYQRPWNKLEKKLKLKKIEEYYKIFKISDDTDAIDNLTTKKKRSVEAYGNYDENVIKLMMFNDKKRIKVDYDIENCIVKSIMVT